MILIVSRSDDDHAQAVMRELEQRGLGARLLDLSDFPQKLHLSVELGGRLAARFRSEADELRASECPVVWWRRPQPFRLHPELTDPASLGFANAECHEAMSGLWLALPAFWINHPTRDEEASRKILQLRVAADLGFEIPRTLVTSDPVAAREFAAALGPSNTVYKAFTGTEDAWRETRVLRDTEVASLDDVRFAPVILQEYVPARLDLRITVMGGQVFASAIHTREVAYQADYRMELGRARVEAFAPPAEIVHRIGALMDRLGLVYGAIDMRVTPEGRYVFFEINPAGQWRFMEDRTGQRMTAAFADLLASHARAEPEGAALSPSPAGAA